MRQTRPSRGEVAAAHVAGVLSLEDATRVICRRSRLLRQTRGQGAMALVELSFDQARAAIAGYEDRLSVAVSNSSRSTVLSGDPAALDELIAALEARDVFCRRVKVDVADRAGDDAVHIGIHGAEDVGESPDNRRPVVRHVIFDVTGDRAPLIHLHRGVDFCT